MAIRCSRNTFSRASRTICRKRTVRGFVRRSPPRVCLSAGKFLSWLAALTKNSGTATRTWICVFKISAAGRRLVYQPASVVTHHESQSGPERFRQVRQNVARLHQKWLGKVQPDFIIHEDGRVNPTGIGRFANYPPAKPGKEKKSRIVSIIILALNQLKHTRACLESMAAHTTVPHEIIVVDNGSTDGTPEFLKSWQAAHANCTVIRNESNRGFAGGNNQGLSIARGDFLVL